MPPTASHLVLGAATSPSAGAKAIHLGTGMSVPGLLSLAVILAVIMSPLLFYRRAPKPAGPENDDNDGWGRGGPEPPPAPKGGPTGGLPLPDAIQSQIRLRGPGRLSDLRPARVRRPAREPGRRPIRTTTPG